MIPLRRSQDSSPPLSHPTRALRQRGTALLPREFTLMGVKPPPKTHSGRGGSAPGLAAVKPLREAARLLETEVEKQRKQSRSGALTNCLIPLFQRGTSPT